VKTARCGFGRASILVACCTRHWLIDKLSDHQLVQTIAHPTISVWTVDVLPNGDIVSGASDSTIRLWTREEARFAQPAERERLDRELRTRALNKTQVGDVRTTDLPGLEALAKAGKSSFPLTRLAYGAVLTLSIRTGKKEGQVIMVKNGDKVEAYQWSSNETTWQQIGEVTDAVGSGRKQIYQGEEYDYVFDVDIAENMPPLKLPFNVTGAFSHPRASRSITV
jgi:phospholipase A-2-activating protein